MKTKIGIIILAVICVGLFVVLFTTKKTSDEQHTQDTATILQFSNDLGSANTILNDVRQINVVLSNNVNAVQQSALKFSNNLAATSITLSNTKASLENADAQIANLNGRVADLEAQNKALDERAGELTNRLAELNALIVATQKKLASSEADNTYLAAELQKQMAQKAELERKFADLSVVREQVKKLREELYLARRIEWINDGTASSPFKKGAELLMQRSSPSGSQASAAAAKTAASAEAPARPASPYDLNVEVGSDGSVHVIPTPASQDNAAQAAARAALMKASGATNAEAH